MISYTGPINTLFWSSNKGRLILLFLPCTLLCGIILTNSFSLSYLIPIAACIFCYRFLVVSMKQNLGRALIIWIMLGIFEVGYFMKFFTVMIFPEDAALWLGNTFESVSDDTDLMTHSFWVSCFAFCGFCIGVALWGKDERQYRPQMNDGNHTQNAGIVSSNMKFILAFLSILLVGTALIQFKYNIATLNQDTTSLPFKFSGLIHYLRYSVFPYFILLLIYMCEVLNMRRMKYAFVFLLIFHALSETVLMTSRGVFLLMLLPLFFLLFLTGKLEKKHLRMLVAVLAFTVISHSLISNMRGYRFYSSASLSKDIGGAFKYSLENSSDFVDNFKTGLGSVFFRVTGLEGLISVLRSPEADYSLSQLISEIGTWKYSISEYFTSQIAGHEEISAMGIAPGLVGLLYLLGGYLGVFLGIVFWVKGWEWIWRKIYYSHFNTSSLMLANLASLFLMMSMEGPTDYFIKPVIATIFSFWMGEKIYIATITKKIL